MFVTVVVLLGYIISWMAPRAAIGLSQVFSVLPLLEYVRKR